MPELHPAFLIPPISHRGYHNDDAPENSRAAFDRSIHMGYGIELDLQLSSDGEAMVFHDYALDRLTGTKGPLRQHTAAQLQALTLSNGESIPTLLEVLKQVSGQVALLVELKDQDGALGPDVGELEKRTAELLNAYAGPVAVMSYNPHMVYNMARYAPEVPRGLTTSPFLPEFWQLVPEARRRELAEIPDYDAAGCSFISHHHKELDSAPVWRIRNTGDPVFCWTVRSEAEEDAARRLADNITFEGYQA